MAGAQEVASDIHSRACASMSEILLERASNIIEIAQKDKKMIHILWSGGIDSTAMVVAFSVLMEKNPALRETITIAFCESAKEDPHHVQFYKDTVLKFKCFKLPQHIRDIFGKVDPRESILVSGDPAHIFFGSGLISQCILDPPTLRQDFWHLSPLYMKLEETWNIFADYMVHKGVLSVQAKPYWVYWIQPFLDKSPIPVTTVFDFLWWCSFGLVYQHNIHRIFYNNTHETIPEEMVDMVVNFYDTLEFSQWSYHFHQSKMHSKKVWASYKHALKDFIRKQTKDKRYYAAKLDVQPVSHAWGFEHGLDNNYNLLR